MYQEKSIANQTVAQRAARRVKNTRRFWIALLAVVLLDQATKWLAVHKLSQSGWPIIGHLVENTGIAFGALSGATWFTLPVAILITVGAIAYYWRVRGRDAWTDIALGFLVGGALSNLSDRLIHNHVIDFIDLRVWPVFNLADTFITISVALLIWRAFTEETSDNDHEPLQPENEEQIL